MGGGGRWKRYQPLRQVTGGHDDNAGVTFDPQCRVTSEPGVPYSYSSQQANGTSISLSKGSTSRVDSDSPLFDRSPLGRQREEEGSDGYYEERERETGSVFEDREQKKFGRRKTGTNLPRSTKTERRGKLQGHSKERWKDESAKYRHNKSRLLNFKASNEASFM